MKRRALTSLANWSHRQNRVPLLIRGARQVGKTWLVREFSKSFPSFLEINLEAQPEYHQAFRDHFGKPDELIRILSLFSGRKIIPGKTLLFLDEIQESKEALLSLRYFKELLPDLHVIAAGSLLEFSIKAVSFPVGRIDFLHLFPLNFEEYLEAIDRNDLLEAIKEAIETEPLPNIIHNLLLDEVATYCLIGGMPEAVDIFISTKDFQEAQAIQQRIIATFREDFHKYASRAKVEYLRKLFDGVPRLLGQKFKHSQIDREMRSRELGAALNLLAQAGLVYKVHHTSAFGLPLSAQEKETKFKVFCLDVGLAQRVLGLDISRLFIEKKSLLSNRGPIAEQLVAQELLSYTRENQAPQLHYWHREAKSSTAEVDFVIERQSYVLPIEVKSGTSSKTKSLRLFMKKRQDYVQQGLKISSANFGKSDNILRIPFFAIGKVAKSAIASF